MFYVLAREYGCFPSEIGNLPISEIEGMIAEWRIRRINDEIRKRSSEGRGRTAQGRTRRRKLGKPTG